MPSATRNFPFAVDYIAKMFPPDFSVMPRLWGPMIETLQMAIAGTVLATMVALPVSFLAARNTEPCSLVGVATRLVLNFLRSMPVMVWALLFVSLSGLGMLAGVLGITSHVVGALGKTFYECIEASGPKAADMLEAMRLDGATERQVIRHGLFPEVLPLFAGYILYRFESTIRTSTIMGLVGAGGIGLELTMAIRMFRRQEVLTIILAVLFLVTIVDHISGAVRKTVLRNGGYE